MAVLNVLVERSVDEVWNVLDDGWAYARWVAGTQEIRDVDASWPEVGSRLHYRAGVGPLTIDDTTIVRQVEPRRRLELEARAGRIGSARISIQLLPWGQFTLVILDEHPLTGPGAWWHSAMLDTLLRVRNRRMMRSLAKVVQEAHPH